jgi:23S rRNA U2552 (ribose-2'-O)-methylase RlmE/FtsJ
MFQKKYKRTRHVVRKKSKRSIKHKKNNKRKIRLQYGGENTETLLTKMRAHAGDFVLVIGSNYRQSHCLGFANSPKNEGKMVISIDLLPAEAADTVNNFKLDFNDIETWNMLHEFDGKFRTVIFDRGTEQYVRDIDYLGHIKTLLMKGGKLYKVFPMTLDFLHTTRDTNGYPIKQEQIIRKFTLADVYNIKMLAEHEGISPKTVDDDLKIITAIAYIRFTRTPYGLARGVPPTTSSNYAIPGIHDINYRESALSFGALEVPSDVNWQTHEVSSTHITRMVDTYINLLFLYYERFTQTRVLREVYGFELEFSNNCIDYPFKYTPPFESSPDLPRTCFVVCTKP